jgi:hypothetical protein
MSCLTSDMPLGCPGTRMRTTLLPLGVASILAVVGCSVQAAQGDAADAEASSPATAVVVVERTGGPGDTARAEAVARFVQMRAGTVDDQALRMVGAAVEFPAIGSCSTIGRTWGDAPARAVRLADVGAVSLEANGVRTSLVARQVPDVADLVSGVVYTARAESSLASRTRYVLRGGGTAEVEAFEIVASAPAEPSDIRIAGQDGRSLVAIAPNASVDVAWDPSNADDLIYIDVASTDPATPIVRCLFPDAGHATVPPTALGSTDDGTLSLHRLHRETFRSRGLDNGEIRFDFSRSVPFTRR